MASDLIAVVIHFKETPEICTRRYTLAGQYDILISWATIYFLFLVRSFRVDT